MDIDKILQNMESDFGEESLPEVYRQMAIASAKKYYHTFHKKDGKFSPGQKIPYASRVFDEEEVATLVDASLDFWLTAGRYAEQFEREFATFLGVEYCSAVNSGSSANLLAFMALTSDKLGERRIKRGDEVITVAAGFPTTIAPIIQYGAVPVFVDIDIPSYNINISRLDAALSPKTKAVFIAHTLGNIFDLASIKTFCDKNNLWLVEDNCDALGGRYYIDGQWKLTGTIGDIGTSSFYPAHQMTMGEGGAVYTNDQTLKYIIDSFRDWGRDCHCPPGKDDTCRHRFTQQFGQLPLGYDHKYVYSHFGYNLKVTDMQAAVGVAQLKKLPDFVKARRKHWDMLKEGLKDVAHALILPTHGENAKPCWFGFIMTVKDDAGFTRDEIVAHLEAKGIQTRNLFAGNIIQQPCFDGIREDRMSYRVVGDLTSTNQVVSNSFWIGVYPGMTDEMIGYMVETIKDFVAG